MNVGLFTLLFISLVVIVIFFKLNEGFEPVLHIPESPVAQKNLVEKSQEDYAPSYILAPGPAPGAIASFNSLPYRDPSLEKANYQRILNVQTTLKGFLENEATHLEELSDPSIQLPLTSARSDLIKLQNEVLVLKRNPGIDSTMTQGDLDEIQANLAYLQRKYRLSIYNDIEYEGFQSGSDTTNPYMSDSDITNLVDLVYYLLYGGGLTDAQKSANPDKVAILSSYLGFLSNIHQSFNNTIFLDGTIKGGWNGYANIHELDDITNPGLYSSTQASPSLNSSNYASSNYASSNYASSNYDSNYGLSNYASSNYDSNYGLSNYASSNYDSNYGLSNYASNYGLSNYYASSNYDSNYGLSNYISSNYDSNYASSNYASSNYISSNYDSNYGLSNYVSSNYASNVQSNSIYNTIMNYFSGSNTSNSNTSNTSNSSNISGSDLTTLINKIDLAIARLSTSGTTDPVVNARISVLTKIKSKVQAILNEVNSGVRAQSDIPITRDAYNNFLKTISDVNSPVSKLFGSNVGLADLLPAYSQGDVNGAKLAQYLFTKYSDMLFNGLSFDINISYTSPAEQTLATNIASAITQNVKNTTVNAVPLTAYDLNTSNNVFMPINSSNYVSGNNATMFSNLTNQYFGSSNFTNSTSNNGPSVFDWHERANFICDSIQKRGLNPQDFGCLRPEEYVSDNFSWRGYAKMICGRLATSMDTGLPEVCGCPPATWVGWRP